MGFRDLIIADEYSSDKDDALNSFYIPVLAESVNYKRIAGFFSSKSLAIAAKGIKGLIENNGEMELIAGAILNEEDILAIREGTESPEQVIARIGLHSIDNIEDVLIKNHIGALAWLITQNRLKIKIALLYDGNDLPLDAESVHKSGIFHQKVGILTDKDGEMISFSGSINETASAWKYNLEEFKVFKNWIELDRARFESDYEKFQRFWNNKAAKVRVIDAPEAIKRQLIKSAPKRIDDLDLGWNVQNTNPDGKLHDQAKVCEEDSGYEIYNMKPAIVDDFKKLRWYQKEAIEQWENNNYCGILEMATGSGKTFVGIMGSFKLYMKKGKLCTVILVPSKQLVNQWGENLRKYTDNCVLISSSIPKKKWMALLDDYIFLFNHGNIDHFYVISTIPSFSNHVGAIISRVADSDTLLLVDEAHWLGADGTRNEFKNYLYQNTLGLTATPVRYFDEEGTNFLREYLGDTVYEFSIKQGQNEGFLCKYNYHIVFVDLTKEELSEYIKYTKLIAMEYGKDDDKTTRYLNKRAKIIKDAVSKYHCLDKLLSGFKGEIKHWVIYTDEGQLPHVRKTLKNYDIFFGEFLGTTPDNDRDTLISKLKTGMIQAIVAIKCLNEGIDIPPLKQGIFLSSSGNPREFIQRRGRLLRTYEGKGIVDMYDFVVAPDSRQFSLSEAERKIHDKILRSEIKRIKDFNVNALNSYVNERILLEKLDMLL